MSVIYWHSNILEQLISEIISFNIIYWHMSEKISPKVIITRLLRNDRILSVLFEVLFVSTWIVNKNMKT